MPLKIELLKKSDKRETFDCGYSLLNEYIKNQASQNVKRDLSACYVMSDDDQRVIGYYTLSSNSVLRSDLPDDLTKKLPRSYHDLPAVLLGRLAVNKADKGNGYGEILLMDALQRSASISEIVGTLAVVVEPIDEQARLFYLKYDFITIPSNGKMFITIDTVKKL